MYHYHIRYTIHSEYDIHIDILNIHMLLLVILTVTRLTLQLIHVNIRDQSRTILRYILNPEAICLLIH